MKAFLTCVASLYVCVSGKTIEFTPATLKEALDPSNPAGKHVFVEFYAPWCGHCQALESKYEYVGSKVDETKENVIVGKIDADKYRSELSDYGVTGFPTLKLFKREEGATQTIKFESAREPKHIIQFINKHTGSFFDADDYKPQKQERAKREGGGSGELDDLYTGFAYYNKLDLPKARQAFEKAASVDDRSGKAAQRLLGKVGHVGKTVTGLNVDEWLQVDTDTYAPPDIAAEENKNILFLLARLDFRSASRGSLEPMLEDAMKAGAYVIRFTGAYTEIDDDITYAVAQADLRPDILISHESELREALSAMHDAMLVRDQKIVWSAHVGIVDDELIKTIKSLTQEQHTHTEL